MERTWEFSTPSSRSFWSGALEPTGSHRSIYYGWELTMAYSQGMGSILLMVLATTACGEAGPSVDAPRDEASTGPPPEVLISTEDGLIGEIADLVLDEDGTIYAVDRQASQVHVVEGPGQVRSLGGPGAGPGEFAQPSTVYRRAIRCLWWTGATDGCRDSPRWESRSSRGRCRRDIHRVLAAMVGWSVRRWAWTRCWRSFMHRISP